MRIDDRLEWEIRPHKIGMSTIQTPSMKLIAFMRASHWQDNKITICQNHKLSLLSTARVNHRQSIIVYWIVLLAAQIKLDNFPPKSENCAREPLSPTWFKHGNVLKWSIFKDEPQFKDLMDSGQSKYRT